MKSLLFIISVAIVAFVCEARQLNRCNIVRELRRHGFPENQLKDWVCLIEKESSGKTHKVSGVNKNGSRDHGLFQINDKYWCSSTGSPGKNCKVTCADVTSDDITKAAECAKKVYARHGFGGWYGWLDYCQGSLPDITSC